MAKHRANAPLFGHSEDEIHEIAGLVDKHLGALFYEAQSKGMCMSCVLRIMGTLALVNVIGNSKERDIIGASLLVGPLVRTALNMIEDGAMQPEETSVH